MAHVAWSCHCGAMHGQLTIGPGAGTHAVCHCDSCVRAQRHFGIEVTQAEGVGVFKTTPDRFVIEAGAEHLGLSQLSPKGSYRWYAKCCGRQIGVTSKTPRFPFIGVVDTIVAEPDRLGPVRSHGFVPQPGGGVKSKGIPKVVMALLSRCIGALTSGRWRQTPFFDVAIGAPIAEPELLPKDAGR